MEYSSNIEFSPPCPFCGDGHGKATTVSMRSYERLITYVCHDCEQTWTTTDRIQESEGLWDDPPPNPHPLKLI